MDENIKAFEILCEIFNECKNMLEMDRIFQINEKERETLKKFILPIINAELNLKNDKDLLECKYYIENKIHYINKNDAKKIKEHLIPKIECTIMTFKILSHKNIN